MEILYETSSNSRRKSLSFLHLLSFTIHWADSYGGTQIADAAEVLTGSRIGWYAAFIGLALNSEFSRLLLSGNINIDYGAIQTGSSCETHFIMYVNQRSKTDTSQKYRGLHVVAGATAIQTIRGGTEVTLVWAIALGVIMWFFSNIRDFSSMSTVGLLASRWAFRSTFSLSDTDPTLLV